MADSLLNNTSTPSVAAPTTPQPFNFASASPSTPNYNVATGKSGINFNDINLTPTSKGGTTFSPSVANAVKAPTVPAAQNTNAPQGLSQYLTKTYSTPNGGQVSLDGSGNVSNYTPSKGFSIDTSGTVPSNALSEAPSMQQLNDTHSAYQDLVNGVANAQGYSPQYIQALQGQYGAQTQGAELQLNQAAINSNLYTGNNLPGDTMNYAQGATAKAEAQNTLQQAQNSIQQLSANQALNTQQLARTGNISAAQTQLASSALGMSSQQAITQYQQLQQEYPGANIPPFNPQADPIQQYNAAKQAVSQSPAYQAGFQSTYTTPGGGTGIYSKLDVKNGGFQQNQDGSYTLVPAAAAALGDANANIVKTQLGNLSNINSAINASQKTLASTQAFMNQYGLNQSGVSLLSQIQNSTNKQLDKAGAIAGLNADLNTLRSDYAQYLIGRGGSVAGTNQEAQAAIPDTISPAQLQTLVQQMQQDGQNTADAVSQQVNQAIQGIKTNTNASTSGAGTNVGSSWANI